MPKQPECPKCRASLLWDGSSAVAVCPQCGAKYQMHPRSAVRPVLMPPAGRGVIDYLTVPNESVIRNRPLIKTYIPKGWHVNCSLAGDRFDLISNPFVVSVVFDAPDNSARIIFTGESFYKHIDYHPQTAMLQNRLDDLTVSRTPTFFRLKSTHTAGEYCDALAQSCGLSSLSLTGEAQPDETELSMQQKNVEGFLAKGFSDAAADWAGKTYRGVSQYGQQISLYAETRVIRLMRISDVPTLQMPPMGGVFGMRITPQIVNRRQQDYFWYTPYEFLLIATTPAFDSAREHLQRISRTLDYLPPMEQARADALALANNALSNIGQAQAASFERRSRIIADTNAYTSNVMHQMINDNAASHNRVANLHSEMIRDVNTYYGQSGVVEASTRFDHVYQNTQYPDLYAAQEGNSFEFGVDFEEPKKTDVDY